jgi:hypothetical protein
VMQDGELVDVNTITRNTFLNDQRGHGFAPPAQSFPIPSRRKGKPPMKQADIIALGAVPFHFGFNAGGDPGGTPGGFAEPNNAVYKDNIDTIALVRSLGFFFNFQRFGYHLFPTDNYLNTLIESTSHNVPVYPQYGTIWPVFSFFFTRKVLEDFFTEWIPSGKKDVIKARDKVLSTFPLTGHEAYEFYTGSNVDTLRSMGWGDPDGYYYMRELFYKNPLAPGEIGSYELRECDWHGVCLIRQRQYTELKGIADSDLYTAGERNLSSFQPFPSGHTFGFHGYYQFNYSSGEYPNPSQATVSVTITASWAEEAEGERRYAEFPWRYSIVMVVTIPEASTPSTFTYEWWFAKQMTVACMTRVYQNAGTAPSMTELADGVGTFSWSGVMTKSLNSGQWFYPYVGWAVSIPSNKKKRVDWGANV